MIDIKPVLKLPASWLGTRDRVPYNEQTVKLHHWANMLVMPDKPKGSGNYRRRFAPSNGLGIG